MTDIPTGLQARTVKVLVAGQILAGLGQGATLSIGAVLAVAVSGSEAWAGAGATLTTLGSAAAAIPLARLAVAKGRRPALSLGALAAACGSVVAVVAAGIHVFPLLLLGFALLGVGSAVGLQARFAATDIAEPTRRGRDLSVVVWSTTIGAIVGPNLFGPGEVIATTLGLPDLTGSFVIAVAAQLLAAATYLVLLRPDPLVLARSRPVVLSPEADAGIVRGRSTLVFAIVALALSHAVMVSVMSMTPVHLTSHGASLVIVGFTISLHIAGMYALSPLFGWASDRFGRIPTLLLGQLLFAVSIVITALGEMDNGAVAVGLVLLGLGWSASTVSASALVSDLVSGAQRVRIQGRSDLVMNIAGAAGGALAGPVLALVGYAGLAWLVGILVLGVIVGALVVTGRVRISRAG
ncbi:MAG: MFS transporter [Salinibacterium sp.]|nr:MFS transporter [Salinibacterium sp.]